MAASEKRPLSEHVSSGTSAAHNDGAYDSGSSSLSAKGKEKSTGDDFLDALVEVFPQVNFLTLVEVCMEYKNDIDGAVDYIIHNVLPRITHDYNANENKVSLMKVDNFAHHDSVQADVSVAAEEHKDSLDSIASSTHDCGAYEHKDSLVGVASSAQDCLFGGLYTSSYNSKIETSFFEDELTTNGDGIPDLTTQSSYSVKLESLDNSIADVNYNKMTLMSNVATVNQMLDDIKLKEVESKQVALETTQAGNDILVKIEELKEKAILVAEENDKVSGEVSAEQSILASEAQGLEARLSNISQESNHYVLIIDEEMLFYATMQRSNKLEKQEHENVKLRKLLMDRGQVVDTLQGEMIGLLEKISQLQLKVNMELPKPMQGSSSISSSAKSIDGVIQLQCRVDEPQLSEDMQPASPRLFSNSVKSTDNIAQAHCKIDEPQLFVCEPEVSNDEASSSLSSLLKSTDNISQLLDQVIDVNFPMEKSLQVASSSFCSSMKSSAGETLQLPSAALSSLEKSTTSKSWSSTVESKPVFYDDEDIDDASSHTNFGLDDSWDVVDDEFIYMCAN
uniref:CUE domain-containing protein n=1 Tax=Leersia perrieri TaxID=77586 RepID=A0A0D9WG71_9ORYZ